MRTPKRDWALSEIPREVSTPWGPGVVAAVRNEEKNGL